MKKNNSSTLSLLAIILTIGAVIISWRLISPSYAANVKKLSDLDQEISNVSSKIESLDITKNDLSLIDSTLKSIMVAVPDNTDEPNLITELEAIALKNNIILPSISISKGQSADLDISGQTISIALNVTGTFGELNGFIEALEKSIKFMNIKSLNYTLADEGKMALSLNIEAYSMSPSSSGDN